MRPKSPELQAICLAAEVVAQTPEAFMFAVTLDEAERVLTHEVNCLKQRGDEEAASRLENVLTAMHIEQQVQELSKDSV